jgi:hypothetical protein
MDSAFLFLLLAVFSGFNCILSALISSNSKGKAKDFSPGPDLASKQDFFSYLKLVVALQSALLWLFLSQ